MNPEIYVHMFVHLTIHQSRGVLDNTELMVESHKYYLLSSHACTRCKVSEVDHVISKEEVNQIS